MIVPFVDLHQQYLGLKKEVDETISDVISNSDFIRGRHIAPFEQEFAALVGVEHCISCGNGTDALYIAMRALGTGPGDEVITTAHSWISTTETISQTGAQVVFCDTDIRTFNIDVQQVLEKITPMTKGIIAVHLCGQPADVDTLRKIADERGLWLIEDCAQAHQAILNGKRVGTYGDISTFSFYPGKNLGAMGDAGCVVTNNESLANWMELFARHGGKGDHQIEGINSRLDGIQAAILRVKLPHLEEWTEARQRAARLYDNLFDGIDCIETPWVDPNRDHVYHLYMIKTDNRDSLQQYLKSRGISTVINYNKALPFYKAYAKLGHDSSDFPNAFENQGRILSIPIFPEITEAQQNYVVDEVKAFLSKK
jgi:dTDP-4-amino-4,6-dideoxygalactose transaminase